MKKILMLASLALLFSLVTAQASPLCTSGSTFTAIKAVGICQFGDFNVRFNDISPSGNAGNVGSATTVTNTQLEDRTIVTMSSPGPTSLTVTFSVLPVGYELNGLNQLGVKQGVGFGGALYTFNYGVEPILTNYGIYSLVYDITGIYAASGGVDGAKQLKDTDGHVIAQQSVEAVQFTSGPVSTTSGTYTFAASLGLTFVQDTLTVLQSAAGGAYIQQGTLTNTLSFQVPEPMSMALAGFGLVGLGVLRRRRIHKA